MQLQSTHPARIVLGDDSRHVTIEKHVTKQGERLRIIPSAIDDTIELDALALEAITWQTQEKKTPFAEHYTQSADVSATTPSKTLKISNEYTAVEVSVQQGETDALYIRSRVLPYSITLEIDDLEWLVQQPHETITEFFEHPFGPEE